MQESEDPATIHIATTPNMPRPNLPAMPTSPPPPLPPPPPPPSTSGDNEKELEPVKFSLPDETMTETEPSATPTSVQNSLSPSLSLCDALGRSGMYSGDTIADTSSQPLTVLPHGSHGIMLYDHLYDPVSADVGHSKMYKNQQQILFPIKYVGTWLLGHWHGKGTVTYNTGDSYEGHWTTSLKQGQGAFTWADGRQYTGMFHNDFRHGPGKYTWPAQKNSDGTQPLVLYTGNFEQNQRSGFGTYIDEVSGIEYSGEWKGGLYNGYGIYQWLEAPDLEDCTSKGRRHAYRGNFSNGKPHGQGIEVLPNGLVRHEGLWEDGEPVLTHEQMDNKVEKIKYSNSAAVAITSAASMNQKSRPLPSSSSAIHDPIAKQRQPIVTQQMKQPQQSPSKPKATLNVVVVQSQSWKDITTGCMCVYRGLWNPIQQCPDGNGTAVYSSGAVQTYEGCFKAGLYHGQGRLWYRNGDMYEGTFIAGQRHTDRDPLTGKPCVALYRWKDGRQYTGQFHANVRQGRGTLVYANQDLYEGDFVAGQREGQGRFVFAVDGSCYTGEWHAGHYHGHGTLIHGHGQMYIGQFQNGLEHGEGKLVDAAGATLYEGEWVRGKRKDELEAAIKLLKEDAERKKKAAAEALADSNSRSEENGNSSREVEVLRAWEDKPPAVSTLESRQNRTRNGSGNARETVETDNRPCEAVVNESVTDLLGCPGFYTGIVDSETRLPHGVGRLVYADGKRIHEGFWKNGSKHGHGRCLFFPQGDFHQGEYSNNLRHGPGKYQWKDGRLFHGSYENDFRHGRGVFEYPSGERFDGNFEKGQRSGYGRYDFIDQDNGGDGYYEGLWKEGRYHGAGHIVWGDGTTYTGEFAFGVPHGKGVQKDKRGNVIMDGFWERGEPTVSSLSIAKESEQASVLSNPLSGSSDADTTVNVSQAVIEHEEKKDDDVNATSAQNLTSDKVSVEPTSGCLDDNSTKATRTDTSNVDARPPLTNNEESTKNEPQENSDPGATTDSTLEVE